MPLPESIETIFAIGIEHSTVVHIDKEHLALNCFFFSEEQIDFDLDPRDFQGDTAGQQISRLLVFLRTIGQLLNKPIVLTPEGGPRPGCLASTQKQARSNGSRSISM